MDAATLRPSPEVYARIQTLIRGAQDIAQAAVAYLEEHRYAYPGQPEDGKFRYDTEEPVKVPENVLSQVLSWVERVKELPEPEQDFMNYGGGYDLKCLIEGCEGKHFPCFTFFPQIMGNMGATLSLMVEENEVDLLQRHFYLAAMTFAGQAITVCLRDEESGLGKDVRYDVEMNLGLTFNPLKPEDYAALADSKKRLRDVFGALSPAHIAAMDDFATRHQQSEYTLVPKAKGPIRISDLMAELGRANAPATAETTQAAYLMVVSAMEKWPEFTRPSVLNVDG